MSEEHWVIGQKERSGLSKTGNTGILKTLCGPNKTGLLANIVTQPAHL